MNNVKAIRDLLGITQTTLAEGMGCTQGNVGHYERGQTVPPEAAKRLIAYARSLGHDITFDHIYGSVEVSAATVPPVTPGTPATGKEPGEHANAELEAAYVAAVKAKLVTDRRHEIRREEDRIDRGRAEHQARDGKPQ